MSLDGWILQVLAGVIVVLAVVFTLRQLAHTQPTVLTAMTTHQRRRAMRQVRRREPVADRDLAGARAVAADAAGQRVLGLMLALTAVVMSVLVISVSIPVVTEVFLVVATAALVAAAIDVYYTAGRARLFLRGHPDVEQASR